MEDKYTHQEEDILDAFNHLQAVGPPQAAWDDIAPGAEEAPEAAEEEGTSDECPMAEEDIQANIKHIVKDPKPTRHETMQLKYTKEANKHVLTNNEYHKCMESLNKEQKEVVMHQRKWCKDTVYALNHNQEVKPYCLFLSGLGGVGKSFVMIHPDTLNLLRCARQVEASDMPILLTAATGVAAHNINGITISSAFVLNDRRR